MMAYHFLLGFAFVLGSMAQGPDEGYSRDQLQPLTKFRSNDCSIRCTFESACSTYLMYRQQHRRTLEGLLELFVFAFGDQCWVSNQHFAHDHCMSTSYSARSPVVAVMCPTCLKGPLNCFTLLPSSGRNDGAHFRISCYSFDR